MWLCRLVFALCLFVALSDSILCQTIEKSKSLDTTNGRSVSATGTPTITPQSPDAQPAVVSQTGAFTYGYPIRVPDGTNGVQPRLSLDYNSSGSNGMLGMGFSLNGLSAITRDPSYPINFDGNDHYLLDGQKLYVNPNDKTWHTEKESYDLIKAYGPQTNVVYVNPTSTNFSGSWNGVYYGGNALISSTASGFGNGALTINLPSNQYVQVKGNIRLMEGTPLGSFSGWVSWPAGSVSATSSWQSVNFSTMNSFSLSAAGVASGNGNGVEFRNLTITNTSTSYNVQTTNPYSSASYWIIQKKDGSKWYYGQTSDSNISAVGKSDPRAWALNRVEDPNGNFYTITYTQSNGAYYPLRIVYTQNTAAGLNTFKTVQFSYENRTDHAVRYSPSAVDINQRLKWISVLIGTDVNGAGGSLIRKYRIDYSYSPSTSRSQVVLIQEYGSSVSWPSAGIGTTYSAGGTDPVLPGVVFNWQPSGGSFFSSYEHASWSGYPNISDIGNMIYGDFRGCGLTDFARVYNDNGYATVDIFLFYGGGRGYYTSTLKQICPYSSADKWIVGDYNGDGKSDIANVRSDLGSTATIDIYSSNGGIPQSGINFVKQRWATQAGAFWNTQQWVAGDFNGDGKSDLTRIFNENNKASVDVFTSSGTNFTWSRWATQTSPYWDVTQKWMTGDFNGDGKIDLAQVFNHAGNTASGTADIGIFVSNSLGNGFNFSLWANQAGTYLDSQKWMSGDFNGDGKTDIVRVFNDSGNASADVFVSTGTGLNSSRWATQAGGYWDSQRWLTGDFNGDGLTDLVRIFNNAGNVATDGNTSVDVLTSTGSSLISSRWLTQGLGTWNNSRQIAAGNFAGTNTTGLLNIINGSYYNPNYLGFVRADSTVSSDTVATITLPTRGSISVAYESASYGRGGDQADQPYSGAGTSKWSIPFTWPQQLAVQITTKDGLGGSNDIITQYKYGKHLFQMGAPQDRKDLGFDSVTKIDVASGAQTVTQYNQTQNTTGFPASIVAGYPANILVQNSASTPNKYSRIVYSYGWRQDNPSALPNVYFVAPTSITSKVMDGLATSTNTRKDTLLTDYDSNGNLLKTTNYGLVDPPTGTDISTADNTIETYSYAKSTSKYLFRLTSKTSQSYDINGALGISGQTNYYYDNYGSIGSVDRGLLTKVENRVDATNLVAQTLAYEGNYLYLGIANKTTDARGALSQKVYDPNYYSAQISTTDPLGFTSSIGYDTRMRPISMTDINGNVSQKTYDSFGRVLKTISPLDTLSSPASENIYTDTASLPASPSSVKTRTKGSGTNYLESYSYFDGLGRVVQSKTQSVIGTWAASDFYYNASGQNYQVSNPYSVSGFAFNRAGTLKTTFTFDVLGRVTQTTDPNASYSRTLYTQSTVTSIDEENHVSDAVQNGNIVTKRSYSGTYPSQTLYSTTTAKTYRGLSQLLDSNGNTIATTFDMLGRKIQYTSPDMGTWNYICDANGNVLSQTDAMGNVTTFVYDVANRLTQKSLNGSVIANYYYDETAHGFSKGKLTRIVQGSNTTTYTYDSLGRQTQLSKTIGTYGTKTRAYAYDTDGRMASQTLPDGETLNYTYANEGYLKTMSGAYAYLSTAQQDFLGRTSSLQYGNNVTTSYQFDPTTLHTTQIVAGGIMSFGYTYDKVGNVKTKTDQLNSANSETYTYDFLDRLSTATGVYGSKNYMYDTINNLLGMNGSAVNTYSAAQPHALIGDGTYTYAYDANGNMTSKKQSGSPLSTYGYDTANRMTQVGMGVNTASYVYDDTRQRVSKTDVTASSNKTTIFWFDDYEETFDNNAGGARIETTKSYTAYGKKIAQRTSSDSVLVYIYQDHLNSTSVVTDNLGTVVSRLQYEPYGKLASSDNGKVRELFTGQDWDASVDLYYYNARFYNPSIGRFMQGDPAVCDIQYAVKLSIAERMNPFMYCGNNPVVYTDPSGMFWEYIVGSAIVIGLGIFLDYLNHQRDNPNTPYTIEQALNAGGAAQDMHNQASGGGAIVSPGPTTVGALTFPGQGGTGSTPGTGNSAVDSLESPVGGSYLPTSIGLGGSGNTIENAIMNNLTFFRSGMGCDEYVTQILDESNRKPSGWPDPTKTTVYGYFSKYAGSFRDTMDKGWNIVVMRGIGLGTDPTPHMGLIAKTGSGSVILSHYTSGRVLNEFYSSQSNFESTFPVQHYYYDTFSYMGLK